MKSTVNTSYWKPWLVVFLAAMALLNIATLWQKRGYIAQGYGDFTAFYTAGKILKTGQAKHLYNLKLQWTIQQQFAGSVNIRNGPLPYIRPPFQSIVFLPLSYLEYRAAFVVWMILKVFILLMVPLLLRPYLPNHVSPWLVGPLMLAAAPVAVDLLQGQDSIVLLLFCVLSFIAAERGADFQSGAFLGLGLFKFNLIIPIVLVLLFGRKPRFAAGFFLTALILFLISISLLGWKEVFQYPTYLWDISHMSGMGVIPPQNMSNLRGLLTLGLGRFCSQTSMDVIYALLAMCGIVFIAMFSNRTGARNFASTFSLALIAALFLSTYSASYDWTLLLLPVLVLAKDFEDTLLPMWLRVACLSLFSILFFIPRSWNLAVLWAVPVLLLTVSIICAVQYMGEGSESRRLRQTVLL